LNTSCLNSIHINDLLLADYNGKEQVVNMDGIKATCVQHEIDHLNGVTFIDHISKLKRDVILKKIKKYKR